MIDVAAIATMLMLAWVVTCAVLAFTQDYVAYAQLMWVVAVVCAVLPCVFACAAMRCVAQFSFSATAEITCKTSPTGILSCLIYICSHFFILFPFLRWFHLISR